MRLNGCCIQWKSVIKAYTLPLSLCYNSKTICERDRQDLCDFVNTVFRARQKLMNESLSSLPADSRCQTLCRPVFIGYHINRRQNDLYGGGPADLLVFDATGRNTIQFTYKVFSLLIAALYSKHSQEWTCDRLMGLILTDILRSTRTAPLSHRAPSCMNVVWIIHACIIPTDADIFTPTN